MTRAQFLNDLYRRLGSLSREQAEQHLTYYAEMLADRMEEGMTEAEAVASMEDVETIAQRILQDEGTPNAPAPPKYPAAASSIRTARPANTPNLPDKKWDWHKPAKYILWGLALLVAGGMLFNRFAGSGSRNGGGQVTDSGAAVRESIRTDYDSGAAVAEDFGTSHDSSHHGISIGPDGIEVGDGLSVGPDGIQIGNGEHGLHVGPNGIEVNGERLDLEDWGDWSDWSDWEVWNGTDFSFYGTDYALPAKGIKDVKIEWVSGQVEIQPHMDGETQDYISFHEHSTGELTDRTSLVYEIDDETLYIHFVKPGVTKMRDAKKLVMYLPDNWLDELEVNTTSAGVSIWSLSMEELEVDTFSGGVALSEVYAKSIDISTTSGEVGLSGITADELEVDTTSGSVAGSVGVHELSVDTTSGSVAIDAVSGKSFHLDSVSGELLLTLDGSGPFDVEMDTTSGNMTLCLPGSLGFSLSFDTVSGSVDSGGFSLSGGGGKYACGSGGSQIDVDSVSGNLKFVKK